jgi:myo-inositol 2-dehydrogenase/D-chiro-inositol 1-dehydrogenase
MHARNLKYQVPGVNVLGVADVFKESAQKIAKELNVPMAEKDYRVLLDNKDIDAVVICSSTDTHAQIISEAAQAGKHIFCEKPIALDVSKIEQAIAAVEKAGVKLQVGFNRRFDPSFKKAQDLVAKGTIGTPHLVKITSRDPEPPPISYIKVSGGIFLDMMIHDFDMARYLLDQEIVELMAVGSCLIDPAIGEAGDIDTAIVTLKYEGGAWGTIDNSRKAVYGYDQRIEVFGSEGCVIVGNPRPTEVIINSAKNTISDKPLYFFIERYQEAYLAEMKEFIKCVQENREPSVGGLDGKISVQMGYAAKESLTIGSFVEIGN